MKKLVETSQFDGKLSTQANQEEILAKLAGYESLEVEPSDVNKLLIRVCDLEAQLGQLKSPPTREETLNASEVCVCGHRQQDYGSPEDSFGLTAKLWSDYKGVEISPVDVSMMMALLKIARVAGGGTVDSFADLAGHAACGGEAFAHKK